MNFAINAGAVVLVISWALFGNAWASEVNPEETAARVVEQFHGGLRRGDVAAVTDTLGAKAVIFESGYAETRADYIAHHLQADIEFAQATQRQVNSSTTRCAQDLCVLMQETTTIGKYKGKRVHSIGVETTVLRHETDVWNILHVHWSSHDQP